MVFLKCNERQRELYLDQLFFEHFLKFFFGAINDEGNLYGLRYTELISPLIKAVQELTTKIETLETKVAALEAK